MLRNAALAYGAHHLLGKAPSAFMWQNYYRWSAVASQRLLGDIPNSRCKLCLLLGDRHDGNAVLLAFQLAANRNIGYVRSHTRRKRPRGYVDAEDSLHSGLDLQFQSDDAGYSISRTEAISKGPTEKRAGITSTNDAAFGLVVYRPVCIP